MSATTAPKNRVAIVSEVEVIVMPVDERVNVGEPWFAEDEVVVGEGVGECIKVVRVVVAADGKGRRE
jgi:hypothetical protein